MADEAPPAMERDLRRSKQVRIADRDDRRLPPRGSAATRRADCACRQLARGVPTLAKVVKQHIAAFCEVARMLTDRLGVDAVQPT